MFAVERGLGWCQSSTQHTGAGNGYPPPACWRFAIKYTHCPSSAIAHHCHPNVHTCGQSCIGSTCAFTFPRPCIRWDHISNMTICLNWLTASDVSGIRQTFRLSDMSVNKTTSYAGNNTYKDWQSARQTVNSAFKTTQSGRLSGFQTCQLIRLLAPQDIIHFRHVS